MQRKVERGRLGQPGKEKAQGKCYCCLQLLSGRCRAEGARLFSEMCRDRTRDKGHQLEHEKIQPGTQNQIFAISMVNHWTGPNVRLALPSLDILRTGLDTAEHPALTGQLLAGWPRDLRRSVPTTHGVHSTDFAIQNTRDDIPYKTGTYNIKRQTIISRKLFPLQVTPGTEL